LYIQSNLDKGNIEIDELYAQLVARIEIFFEKLKEFCHAISILLNNNLVDIKMNDKIVQKFYDESRNVNDMEWKYVMHLINENKNGIIIK
jgi:hypothetical protein